MPTYEYACTDCGERLEVVQRFTDDALTVCPACQGRLRKLFSAVGVVFKGSGFYKTDSRSSPAPAKAGDGGGEKKAADPTPSPAGSSDSGTSSGSSSSGSSSGSGSSGGSGSSTPAKSGDSKVA